MSESVNLRLRPSPWPPLPAPLFGPEPDTWRAAMGAWPVSAAAKRFREQLGIETDRPVVMSGHQAEVWHPGIVAKWFACIAAAKALDAQPVWLIADQDANDPAQIACPTVSDSGELTRDMWEMGGVDPGVSNAKRGAIAPEAVLRLDESWAAPGVEDGLARIRERVAAHSSADSIAEQFGLACVDLLSPMCPSPTLVYTSRMSQTDAFGEILDAMRADPRACASAYNDAANQHRSSGVRDLHIDEATGRVELPVWELTRSGRTPVFADSNSASDDLAPRALLMTALVRTYACEIFIHGTGGAGLDGDGGYESVTDQWWQTWRGEPPRAPAVMTTATRTLAIQGDIPTPMAVQEARGKAHKAKHDPSLVGDAEAAESKRDLLAAINEMKAQGENPSLLFREMQDLLTTYRDRRAGDIAQLEERAEQLERRAGDAAIAHDRTWAFPLYESAQISSLCDQIFAAFGTKP